MVPVAAVADTVANSTALSNAIAKLDVEPANVTRVPFEVAPAISPTVLPLLYSKRVVVPLTIEVLLIVRLLGPVEPVGPVGPVGPATVDAAPVAPVGPVGPVGPTAPVLPVGPVGPVGPTIP